MEDDWDWGWSCSVAYRSVCGWHLGVAVGGLDEKDRGEYSEYVLVDETGRALWHTDG